MSELLLLDQFHTKVLVISSKQATPSHPCKRKMQQNLLLTSLGCVRGELRRWKRRRKRTKLSQQILLLDLMLGYLFSTSPWIDAHNIPLKKKEKKTTPHQNTRNRISNNRRKPFFLLKFNSLKEEKKISTRNIVQTAKQIWIRSRLGRYAWLLQHFFYSSLWKKWLWLAEKGDKRKIFVIIVWRPILTLEFWSVHESIGYSYIVTYWVFWQLISFSSILQLKL